MKIRRLNAQDSIVVKGVFVYLMLLGLPLLLAFGFHDHMKQAFGPHWWMVLLFFSFGLGLLAPLFYLRWAQTTQNKILQEQRRYHETLRNASLGIGRIKDLNRLLGLTVHMVTRTVRIEHCEIFTFHNASQQFILKASKRNRVHSVPMSTIANDSPLIRFLKESRGPLVYADVAQNRINLKDPLLNDLKAIMKTMRADLIIPSFIEKKMLALFILGPRVSGQDYTQDDKVVFSILANQVALAIENAQFVEDSKKTHEQLFRAEKMATIGTMADGLSHQINNRLHTIGFIAGDAMDTIKVKGQDIHETRSQEIISEIGHALRKIEENVKRGGDIVDGLLKYTRKGDEGLTSIDVSAVLDASVDMACFKVNMKDFDLVRHFDQTLEQVSGNFTQMQEVFFNIIDNAYDAISQRKDELREPDYRGCLEIFAQKTDRYLELRFVDNGMGARSEDLANMFTPFFSTKLKNKKGTGLGMYVVKRIIEENHKGSVAFNSVHGKGSEIKISIPLANNT